jgi:hypothetical protein
MVRGSLSQIQKFIELSLNESFGDVIRSKSGPKLVPSDDMTGRLHGMIMIPQMRVVPRSCWAAKSAFFSSEHGADNKANLDSIVVEPPELFRLKCANDCYTADINSTHFKRNNPLVCRVSARYNHSSTGSKQVYLARRRVYNHSTTHQLLIYRYANIITNLVQT